MIIKKISWIKAALFTVIFAVLYIVINFSGIGVAGLLKITDGANILDFEFGYTHDEAYEMLTALGSEGRAFYLTKIVPMDFPFPFAYMLCYAGWIALLLQHINPKTLYRYLLFVPILAMLFDWIENVGIIAMLRNYPSIPAWAAFAASFSGILKSSFTVGSIGIIAVFIIILIYKKTRK
jgi:hypothetical protein